MKRTFLSFFSLLLLVACGEKNTNTNTSTNPESTTVETIIDNVPSDTSETAAQEQTSEDDTEEPSNMSTSKIQTNEGEAYKLLRNQSWNVKGGTSIKNIINALIPGISEYSEYLKSVDDFDMGSTTIDEKNGYFRHSEEGAGGWQLECVQWVRKDGKRLVGLYSHSHDMIDVNTHLCESYLTFFLYNNDKKCLEPIDNPFNLELKSPKHMECALPKKGMDIDLEYADIEDKGDDYNYQLKWNGMGFDVVKLSDSNQ